MKKSKIEIFSENEEEIVMNNITDMMNNVTTFFVEFLKNRDNDGKKVKIEKLIEDFQAEETQAQLKTVVQENLIIVAKKEKKLKDKDAPKRGRSAYIFYCMQKRPKVTNTLGKELSGKLLAQGVMSKLAEDWRNCSDEKKEKYVKMMEEDKLRAKADFADYVVPTQEELMAKQGKGRGKGKGKKPRKPKDPNAPKRYKTGFQLYQLAKREEVKADGFEGTDVNSELGKRWKALSEKKKAKYMAESLVEKEAYLKVKAKYDKEHPAKPSEPEAEEPQVEKEKPKRKSKKSEPEEEPEEEPVKAPKKGKKVVSQSVKIGSINFDEE